MFFATAVFAYGSFGRNRAAEAAVCLSTGQAAVAQFLITSRVNEKLLRLCVVAIGVALTIGLFLYPV